MFMPGEDVDLTNENLDLSLFVTDEGDMEPERLREG